MKTNRSLLTLALLVLCSAATLSAASPRSFGEIPLDQVTARVAANGDTVTAGTGRVMVSLRLGSPNKVLADGSWLYSGYSARFNQDGARESGTLVVRFSKGQVASLSLVDAATVVALRQAPARPATGQLLAVR
jgi:hypothetical protein